MGADRQKAGLMARTRRIAHWDPEDLVAWEAGNKLIARRNLIWSIATMHVAFSIWYLWSVMVLFMPQARYGFTTGDKLLVGATAALVGALVRIPYAMGTARLGGRNWAVLSSLVLLIPTLAAIVLLAHPGLPLWPYLVCAALTGLGGGNYAAALANVESFFPQRRKGFALGLTGGVGNLGAAGIQAVGLVVLATAGNQAPYWVCAVYLVLLALVGAGAALFMDNLDHSVEVGHVRSVLTVPDTWTISFLYMCASGSFIGFAFAFGQVIAHNLIAGGQTHGQAALHAAEIAFAGPLLGSMARVVGGKLGDRFDGGRVTLTVLAAMIVAGGFLVAVSTHDDLTRPSGAPVSLYTTAGYIAGFIALFICCGVGKGSVFKLIPSVFAQRSRALELGDTERRHWERARSAALIGFAGSFGALGGVVINLALRQSYASTGSSTPAFGAFMLCYVAAAALTWARYVRPRRAPEPRTAPDWQPMAEQPVSS
ncbi:major facilitator transporter [Mycobacterium avium subsp. hominissuis 101]|nr:major facilitator transporter [Mycobacterium avium subsp. silvaticum ATCC 49884]ETB17387.1 major facilitator transporter [Mycobacterium avium subsp. avium 10-9275]ETB21837.1 major facilitator transporter [Mycobacterium avium subsp. avium 11-4751]KDP06719.1 major facilitator transporter [Mycobacterium avium subsp. hominissuis 101]